MTPQQKQKFLALAIKNREKAIKRSQAAVKANLSTRKQKQISSKDPEGTAYAKALWNMGSAAAAITSGLQKKKKTFGRGQISWKSLREKQSLALSKQLNTKSAV